MRGASIIAAATLAFLATAPASAADPAEGRRIAERWCSACHVISAEQSQGSEGAPTFSELAGRIDFRSRPLAEVLAGPHPSMPNMQLGRREADDLTAYIRSQK